MTDLICISHLRWDFVWQRPQHLLSRLGDHYRIFFVEEPITIDANRSFELEVRQEPNNVTVIRLLVPSEHPRWIGHGDPKTAQQYEVLLKAYLADVKSHKRLFWLYTPMGNHFTKALSHYGMIYDVMDELSAFKGAPPDLRFLDQTVADKADMLFTGGLSLYEKRHLVHPKKTFLFPSGVDIAHFARARHRENIICPDDMPDPANGLVMGYYGVIDERMDLTLISDVAARHPEWQFVMIGPVLKIGHHELPQAPNLHYLGKKSYEELPAYLAYFDVALIPFALNEATKFLSPTKTLEYMAAHKPIVSTPIRDVAALYGQAVHIADTADAFVAAIQTALDEPIRLRGDIRRKLLEEHTWESITTHMLYKIKAHFYRSLTPIMEAAHETAI